MKRLRGRVRLVLVTDPEMRVEDPNRTRIGFVVEADGHLESTIWLSMRDWSRMIGHVGERVGAAIEHEEPAEGGETA